MDIFVGVIVGLLVLMILVTLHEFGHFIMARRNGVRVLEFGIGFPPKAIAWVKDPKTKKWKRLPKKEWGKEQEGLIFSLNWLPIGGFCQMDGESDAETRKGTFGSVSFWKKTKILFGGVAMNWLTGIVIFTILAWAGMPEFLDNQFTIADDTRTEWVPIRVAVVAEGSPADAAGFKTGDYLLSVDGNAVKYASDLTSYNNTKAGQAVNYQIMRGVDDDCIKKPTCDKDSCECAEGAETLELVAVLNPEGSDYLLGVSMESSQMMRYSTWSAPLVGVGLTAQITAETFHGIGDLLWNLVRGVGSLFSFDSNVRESGQQAISEVGESVSGPVGIIGVLFPAFTSAGPANLAFLAALISISLACMNVLPIPALDGGRWLLIAIYRLRHKKLTKEIEERIVSRAFIVLILLMLVVTVLDITRFFR
ncbi:site-2 protease family protein [Candidatus Saccharibacteria bacterium]|nr:site-2 protease family protein [Candidatus Saccharibacteria bacterium]